VSICIYPKYIKSLNFTITTYELLSELRYLFSLIYPFCGDRIKLLKNNN